VSAGQSSKTIIDGRPKKCATEKENEGNPATTAKRGIRRWSDEGEEEAEEGGEVGDGKNTLDGNQ
jgi:hypothetical protein